MAQKKIIVTGGAGFIGSNFIRYALGIRPDWVVWNLDALTYAGNPANLEDLPPGLSKRYHFIRGDIRDTAFLKNLFSREAFDGVIHFAAESHVDRSIQGPRVFIDTNVTGTLNLLEASLNMWKQNRESDHFRFLHISTDEVYGSLGPEGSFSETTPYDPSSPYSASKAGSDHLVNAYFRTFGLPALVTNCSNNFGPFQFPEKLIPLMILNIIEEKELPVYGDGKNVRDWLYVIDHCEALIRVFEKGGRGETYNVGGGAEFKNIDIVHLLCRILDERLGRTEKNASSRLIRFVTDRPGHDRRYAINASKIEKELGWTPKYRFEEAITETVDWYLEHMAWVESVRSGEYRNWIRKNYQERLPGRLSGTNFGEELAE
jgi:dTDP-glucose 4,6-dehydratase